VLGAVVPHTGRRRRRPAQVLSPPGWPLLAKIRPALDGRGAPGCVACDQDPAVIHPVATQPVGRVAGVLPLDARPRLLGQAKHPRDRLSLFCLLVLGLRRGELAGIQIRDFDAQRGVLRASTARARKERLLPLRGPILAELRLMLSTDMPHVGRPPSPTTTCCIRSRRSPLARAPRVSCCAPRAPSQRTAPARSRCIAGGTARPRAPVSSGRASRPG
jgi:integrase